MRFRPDVATVTAIFVSAFVAACSSGSEETHGVGDRGRGGTSAGGTISIGGTIGSGGTGSTIPLGGTGTGAAGSSSAGTGGNDMCATTTTMATPEAPVLMFLVDLSLSMNDPAPGSMMSKWIETRDALDGAFTSMRDGTNVGMTFYPDVGSNAMGRCFDEQLDVPIAALDATQRGLLGGALDMEQPAGSTPTHDAYVYALDQLRAATQRGQKYVVLITDGIPTYGLNCSGTGMPNQMPPVPTEPLVAESAAAMAEGIRTFVIGSPGSDGARASLSQMASQGGTARANCSDAGPEYCHLDMTTEPNFSTALNAALDEVIAGIPLTCNFNIPPPPAGQTLDRGKVNVTYTDGTGTATTVGRDASLDALECKNGWQYSPDYTQVTLCGDLCEAVKADPRATVTIVLGCTTIIEPP
jgi:hypothetical protein